MNDIPAAGVSIDAEAGKQRSASGGGRPWIYGILAGAPSIVESGVVQGPLLAYLLSRQGIRSGAQSHVIALVSLPTTLYFLWSPITDFFVRRRTWLLIGGIGAAAWMWLGLCQTSLASSRAIAVMFLSLCFGRLAVSSCGGMMGALTDVTVRRRAGGLYQAGSLGIGAISAWVLVWFSGRTSRNALALIAAILITAPLLFVALAPKQDSVSSESFQAKVALIAAEFRTTFWRWDALPYTLCMLFPMASGAATSLLSGVAVQYGVPGDGVAWLNGLLGGLLTMAGATAGAMLPSRFRAPVLYMLAALANCAALCVLWLGPLRPGTYYAGVALYLLTIGACNATFTAVVLEFMGHSGKSGGGRYSIINSLGNVPVLYMLAVDGWGGDRWGARGLAGTEAVVGAAGAAILLGYFLVAKSARRIADSPVC